MDIVDLVALLLALAPFVPAMTFLLQILHASQTQGPPQYWLLPSVLELATLPALVGLSHLASKLPAFDS